MIARWPRVARLLRVPLEPPLLPVEQRFDRFPPDPGYRRYMILVRWAAVGFATVSALPTGILLVAFGEEDGLALLIFGAVMPLLGVLLHIAATVRYGTTWYALGDRSVRIRKGLWTINEVTITYENVQNVKITQGPLQRFFGISTIEIETAGGGTQKASPQGGAAVWAGLLQGLLALVPGGAALSGVGWQGGGKREAPGTMVGLGDPQRIRETILAHVRRSKSAGLGDESAPSRRLITAAHVAALHAIRDTLRASG